MMAVWTMGLGASRQKTAFDACSIACFVPLRPFCLSLCEKP